jgi:glycine/D-amino acid oxidase-like deaminating enzyme/nitrite reductase/ring-hydroxylating ferredoxin subunit
VLRSLWFEGRDAAPHPPLDREIAADVVVVGAGIVGLTTALLLEREGMDVVVLEMRRVAAGATGYNTAKLSSLHGLTYTQLASSLGREKARLYGEANEAGIARVFELAGELGVDCDLARKPNYTYSEDAAGVKQLREEARLAAELGLPASYVEELDLPFGVAGAVRFDDQAEFNPVRYVDGLAAALRGPVHEGTRVTGLGSGGVKTAVGQGVRADHVVVATHLSFLDRGLYFARCHPERSYVVAGRTGGALPAGMYLSTESPAHSIRAHGDWLLVGGESHKTGQADAGDRYDPLGAWARERFGLEPELRWATQDQMPVDGVPYVGRHDPVSGDLWVATGFKKWGLAMGTAAAELLTAQIAGRDHPWTELFDPNRLRPRASAADFVKENANVAYHFAADRIAKRGNPRCTHLGCLLDWNAAEETWDCPCHGSRFAASGEVIEGPAVRPLEA